MLPGQPERRYAVGTFLLVRYGTFGTQVARVVGHVKVNGRHLVRKWSKNSRSWTKTPRPVFPREIVRELTAPEARRVANGLLKIDGGI